MALHSAGQTASALKVLREADISHPYSPEILGTLVSMNREAGDLREALGYARKLGEALPDNPSVRQLLTELEAAR